MKVHTKSGFVCEVNERKARDWEFVEALADCESEKESEQVKGITKVIPFLLGKEGSKALQDHVRDKDGVADIDLIMEEFKEILIQIGEKSKKS